MSDEEWARQWERQSVQTAGIAKDKAVLNAEEWKRQFQRATECTGNKMSDEEWARQWERQSVQTAGIAKDKASVTNSSA